MLSIIHRHVIVPLRDFIYPPVCFTCKTLLSEDVTRVCARCWNSFTRIDSRHPTWNEIQQKFETERIVEGILSSFLFEKDGKLQEVIHHLKYSGMKSLGVRLGEELGKRIVLDERFADADFLVPVPLHKLKQRERGYNQSEYICRGISHVSGIAIADSFVIRAKYTQSQTQLNVSERRENVGEAFRVLPAAVPRIGGKTFILVDDVVTTGSTIDACAREFLASGARRVLAASVALAQ
ncbi:MAG: ComF family protein [Ignavibacteriae bacterium]|nr:ComF family protein [Ignavibacteria bacterium]MBI3365166.1 ComF family protein [Ignavibacteriota bacterium]